MGTTNQTRRPGWASDVQVWRISLRAARPVIERAWELLDPTERLRAQAFRGEHLSRRFILRHAARRTLLAAELGTAPEALLFGPGPAGKPHVLPAAGKASPGPGHPIEFNDTDSGDEALVAMTCGRRLGIDLEERRALDSDLWATRSLFAPAERAALDALPEARREEAFFACWTRKEALLKALGTGLQVAPDVIPVPVGPLPPTGVSLTAQPVDPARFTIRDLEVGPGLAAALALEGESGTVEWREWEWRWEREAGPSCLPA